MEVEKSSVGRGETEILGLEDDGEGKTRVVAGSRREGGDEESVRMAVVEELVRLRPDAVAVILDGLRGGGTGLASAGPVLTMCIVCVSRGDWKVRVEEL